MTAMRPAKMTPRPRKWSLASAYPASESKNTLPVVTNSVTMAEFLNQMGKAELTKSCW
jgi:hypothetical protein